MATNFTKTGSEIQINVPPNLEYDQFDPDATALSDGGFFVVFLDVLAGHNYQVIGQFFTPDGRAIGSNLDIETGLGSLPDAAVAARAGGGAIVVWSDWNDSQEIEFVTVSNTGLISAEFDVLTGPVPMYDPDVAMLADGRTLVVAEVDASGLGIAFNFINAAGDGTTGQGTFESEDPESDPAVASFGNNALVVYGDWGTDTTDIVARFYDGTTFAAEITIDTSASDTFNPAVAALADGRFIVVWEDDDTDTISARFVGSTGIPLGAAFTIFDGGGGNWDPSVAGLPDGGFVVTCTNEGDAFPGEEWYANPNVVVGRRFENTGAPAGDTFLVNESSRSDQDNGVVAVNGAGQAFAAWEDWGERPTDDHSPGIRGQAFLATETINGSAADDVIETYNISETINGLDGNDNIRALGGNDVVDGGSGEDVLSGGDGNDTVNGGTGRDILFGDEGADDFLFSTALKPKGSNVDVIADFSVAEDTIQLDEAIFKKLKTEGQLKTKYFEVGKKAHDKNDFIVYNAKTGDLSYDKNGDMKGGTILFAHLEGSPDDLSAADFFVL